eukprot:TRINITY_DN642_c0_g1_i1.p1 TRINITY_DN642_c0_g1~~TRINITY_DN642_c0_g1_i1.p1  ORF type:complete len:216 (-),score=42.88 TRINITY_DN642_c0_g1_i1:864-1511(-)
MSQASSPQVIVEEPQEYAALKGARGPKKASCCGAFKSSIVLLLVALFLGGIVFLLWPSTPEVEVKEITLDGISISQDDDSSSIIPSFSLDVSLELVLEIKNENVYGLTYDNILVHIFYRGDEIAQVESDGGSVGARSVTNATATLELEGKQILDNFGDLWSDVSNRSVPLVAVAELKGNLELLFFRPYIEVNSTCELVVDPEEKVITSQECNIDI